MIVTNQPVGSGLKRHQALGRGVNTAQNAHHELQENWTFDEALFDVERECLQMADIVDFKLKARASKFKVGCGRR